ncbi:hypothetical protein FJZ40_04125 [Candidatus Shapirobacteria bacterium]|nr:hypothetical protein [Candidatus Shapirobacteria bacterium]
MNNGNNKKWFVFFGALLIFLVLVLAVFISQSRTSLLGRAAGGGEYSLANSYLFGSPLSAASGGGEKIKISAFLLNGEGRGVEKKRIEIQTSPLLELRNVQPLTDNLGQAIFEVSSAQPGQSVATALVDGNAFPQTVTLTFR